MYIIRDMSYSMTEKPEALEPERFTPPLRIRASKNSHQMVAVTELLMEARGVEPLSEDNDT